MNKKGAPPPHKGPRWIVDQITAAFEASQGRWPEPAGLQLNRVDVGKVVTRALKEVVVRVEGEKDIKDTKDHNSKP